MHLTVQHRHVVRVKLVPRCGTSTVKKHRGKCTGVYSTSPQSGSGTSAERCSVHDKVEIVKCCIKVRYKRMCRLLTVICYTKAGRDITVRVDEIVKGGKGGCMYSEYGILKNSKCYGYDLWVR